MSLAVNSWMWCPAIFHNLRIDSQQGHTNFRPCCAYRPDIAVHDLVSYDTSSEIELLRASIHSREWLPGCGKCREQEQRGSESLRQIWMKRMSNLTHEPKITHLEILPSNTCNLRCYMCDADHSSSVSAEHVRLGWITQHRTIDLVDQCISLFDHMLDLRSVSFIGGEFFLTPRVGEIIDLVTQRGLAVEITTNATRLLPEHVDRLRSIPELTIQVSVDGIGDAYEFMRYPARWLQVSENIDTIRRELPQAKLVAIFVVQVLNLHHMVSVMNYFNRRVIAVNIHDLVDPTWLSLDILDQEERDCLIAQLDQQRQQYRLTVQQQGIITGYQKRLRESVPSDQRIQFVSRMQAIIKSRGMSTVDIDRHLADLPTLSRAIAANQNT